MTVLSRQRTARASVFAVVCVFLAITGHGWVAGESVSPIGIGLGFVAVFLAALWAGYRQWTSGHIIVALLVCQLGLHVLFAECSGVGADPGGRSLDHARMGVMLAPMPDIPMVGPHQAMSAMHMLAGHLLAAAISGWWLAYGEAAAWRTVRRAGNGARTAAAVVVRATNPALRGPEWPSVMLTIATQTWEGRQRAILAALVTGGSPRRGPPIVGALLLDR